MKKVIFLILLIAYYAQAQQTYVGDKACSECHSKEMKEWKGSDHDLAMKEPNERLVIP